MIMLATLNMLLNGDGNAKLKAKPGFGSILSKFDSTGELLDLVPSINISGNWDKRVDNKKLKKFNVVLTNPPFGEDRAYRIESPQHKEIIECFELWHLARSGDSIDLGLVFLENAYRILDTNGRVGIVLSNSIASVDKYQKAREWLLSNMRVVAIFDMPPNVFAETGVPTTIIVAYKPEPKKLEKLKKNNYKIFLRDIHKVGYEVRTSKRVKYFADIFKINYDTFEIEIDKEGRAIKDEEFSSTIFDFRKWCRTQEKILQDLFVNAK
jgi:type I restriction enzyme M protein